MTSKKNGFAAGWLLWVVALLVLFGVAVWGTGIAAREQAVPDTGTTIGEIVTNPNNFYGNQVTISGEVERVVGPRSFIVGGDDFFGPEILILTREPVPAVMNRTASEPLAADDIVLVSGTVRRLVVTEVEPELSLDLEEEVELEFSDRPVIIADSVRVTPRTTEGIGGTVLQPQEDAVLTDINQILDNSNPLDLVNRQANLDTVQVQRVVGDKTFWVGSNASEVVLVRLDENTTLESPTEGRVNINPGQVVSLTGTIQELPDRNVLLNQWGLEAAEANQIQDQEIYLQAEQARIIER